MTPQQDRYRRYEVARDYLTSVGIKTLDRYWQATDGTLEIVAEEGDTLVAVILQVTGTAYVPPKATSKRQRRLAVAWMASHGTKYPRIRVDVVSIHLLPMGQSNLEHMRSVDA